MRAVDRQVFVRLDLETSLLQERDDLLVLVDDREDSVVRFGMAEQLAEVEAIASRHREGKSIMDQLGRFAPAYGMIGTLMGLIMMLQDMSDPSGIGAGMAIALITTLYGAIVANVFFSPFAEKLGLISRNEMVSFEIAIRGVMAIQSGESPRAIDQKLRTFLPPKQRESE